MGSIWACLTNMSFTDTWFGYGIEEPSLHGKQNAVAKNSAAFCLRELSDRRALGDEIMSGPRWGLPAESFKQMFSKGPITIFGGKTMFTKSSKEVAPNTTLW